MQKRSSLHDLMQRNNNQRSQMPDKKPLSTAKMCQNLSSEGQNNSNNKKNRRETTVSGCLKKSNSLNCNFMK